MPTSTTPEPAAVRGRVLHDGRPQTGARVLWLAPGLDDVHVAGESDAGGAFALDGPAGEAVLLARLRGPALGAVHATVTAPADDVALDLAAAPAAVWPVTLRATGDVPPRLTVLCTPAQLPGLPAEALQWTYRLGPDTNETFAVLELESEAQLAVQAGEWRFSATHAEGARARGVDTERSIWFTAAARVDGQEVPCDGAGAKVVVDRALTLELAIRRGVQR